MLRESASPTGYQPYFLVERTTSSTGWSPPRESSGAGAISDVDFSPNLHTIRALAVMQSRHPEQLAERRIVAHSGEAQEAIPAEPQMTVRAPDLLL